MQGEIPPELDAIVTNRERGTSILMKGLFFILVLSGVAFSYKYFYRGHTIETSSWIGVDYSTFQKRYGPGKHIGSGAYLYQYRINSQACSVLVKDGKIAKFKFYRWNEF